MRYYCSFMISQVQECNMEKETKQITVLGKTFNSEEERRTYFREELRKHLPELKKMEGFPIGEDNAILNLSDPPFYTACPNPWLNDFIKEWEEEKKQLEKEGKRSSNFIVDEPYAADVSEGKNNPIYNAHSYHTKVPHPAIMRYILKYTQPGDIILDGFAGTGMTGVAGYKCESPEESLKLLIENEFRTNKFELPNWGKRHTICGDLSVVASFISNVYTSSFDLDEFIDLAESIFHSFSDDLGWMYETTHVNGKKGKVNYFVWSEHFECPNCKNEFSFTENFYEPESKKVLKTTVCEKCDAAFQKKDAELVKETVYDTSLNKTIKIPKRSIYKINYTWSGDKFEKVPDSLDLEIIQKIKNQPFPAEIPNFELPNIQMKKVGRITTTGITHIHLFYLKRAIISIDYFWNKIDLFKTTENKNLYQFMIEQMVWGMSLLNRFRPTGFSQVNQYMSGVFYAASHSSEIHPMYLLSGKFKRLVKAFRNLNNSDNRQVNFVGDCGAIAISDNSIDYIFTDPPFGENIYYSDLNLLIEAWYKVLTNPRDEAIIDKAKSKSIVQYQSLMQKCFSNYYRCLKPGKWMTVEFSNTSAAVWNGIQNSLQNAGFILANVSSLDKQQGTFQAVMSPTAVKQDLVISCYKPSSEFDEKFKQHQHTDVAVWDFVEEHLHHLPIHLMSGSSTTAIIERSPKILFDRLIAFYVQKSLPVPIDAGKFQQGLRERFIDRDGMFFTNEQVQEYDKKKAENPEFIQLSILVSSEQDGVLWLKNLLTDKSLTYQDIQPLWMQALAGVRKGDVIPELVTILEENFLKDTASKWYAPDPENEADLEKLRTKRLLRQFDAYKVAALKPKTKKIKEVRVEALRAGFKQCYQDKDFKSIVIIGDKIPNNLLMEDEVLLQFYDIASSRV